MARQAASRVWIRNMRGTFMANAHSGQSEIALGTPPAPVRLLHFLSARAGRHFIDIFGGYVYEIRAVQCGDELIWETLIRRRGDKFRIARGFHTLEAAADHLQAKAVEEARRGGRP
jgi:hypothetical protein